LCEVSRLHFSRDLLLCSNCAQVSQEAQEADLMLADIVDALDAIFSSSELLREMMLLEDIKAQDFINVLDKASLQPYQLSYCSDIDH
jgi:MarR-like DNA-binding transcriptional regulator SgrR of sgrS sRNA